MKKLNLTTLVGTALMITSSFAFARGHDIPERYEWEAQLDQIQEQERAPSSQEEFSEKFNKDERQEDSFQIHYSN